MLLVVCVVLFLVLFSIVTGIATWRRFCRHVKESPKEAIPAPGGKTFLNEPVAVTVTNTPFVDFNDSGVSSISSVASSAKRLPSFRSSESRSSLTSDETMAEDTRFSEPGYSRGSSEYLKYDRSSESLATSPPFPEFNTLAFSRKLGPTPLAKTSERLSKFNEKNTSESGDCRRVGKPETTTLVLPPTVCLAAQPVKSLPQSRVLDVRMLPRVEFQIEAERLSESMGPQRGDGRNGGKVVINSVQTKVVMPAPLAAAIAQSKSAFMKNFFAKLDETRL